MPITSVEEVTQSFADMGTVASEDVLIKCVELCIVYGENAESFVDTWFTYSASKLGGSVPTIELLKNFEKDELSRKKPKQDDIVIHTAETIQTIVRGEEEKFLEEYGTPSSKTKQSTQSPLQNDAVSKLTGGSNVRLPFSPNSLSPAPTAASTPSAKYAGRKSKGDVVSSYGNMAGGPKQKMPINLTTEKEATTYKHMFLQLWEKAELLSDIIENLAEKIESLNNLECVDVSQAAQDEVSVVGRIACDSVGRLNASSVLLESSLDRAGGEVRVDLSTLSSYALFPGQVVALKGTNPTGRMFVANELIRPQKLSISRNEFNFDEGPLRMVVAAGPFTVSDNLLYEPLDDLLDELGKMNAHVLLLIGPFIDMKNQEISSGNPIVIGDEMCYQDLAARIVSNIAEKAKSAGMKAILCASSRDLVGDGVYPAPPPPELLHPDVRVVSDPCFLNINGFTAAVTSADILMHLGKEEINLGSGGDRLGRLANHVLEQQCFYPLYPPNEEMNVEYRQMHQHTGFPFTPNLLVLPSDLRNFVKNIDNCCVLNPERLAKGMAGGYYAVVEAHSPTDVRGQVLRI